MLHTTNKTLDSWQAEQGNIFEYLIDTLDVSYLKDTDADSMQFLLSSLYGQRTLRNMYASKSSEQMGRHIEKIFGHLWQIRYEAFERLMALEGDSLSESESSSSSNSHRDTTTNQMNKTSSFDSDDMVVNDGAELTGGDTSEQGSTGRSKSTITTQAGLMEKERIAKSFLLQQDICKTIAEFMTLAIY